MPDDRADTECILSADAYPYLSEYEVDGRAALPAATAIELALAAVGSALERTEGFALHDVRIAEFAPFDDFAHLSCGFSGGVSGTFQMERKTAEGSELLGRGRYTAVEPKKDSTFEVELDALVPQEFRASAERVSLGALYTTAVQRVVGSDRYTLAELDPEIATELATEGYSVHPIAWQLAIEVARTLLVSDAQGASGTLSAGTISIAASARPVTQIRARRDADSVTLQLIDSGGGVIATLEDLSFLAPSAIRPAPAYTVQWCKVPPLAAGADASARWHVAGNARISAALREHLSLSSPGQATHIVYASDDVPEDGGLAAPLAAAWAEVSRLAAHAAASGARLWILTQGAQERPQQAALWGFGLGLAHDQPKAWGGLIDLSAEPTASELAAALAEIAHGDEDQVALHGAARLVPRLVPHAQPDAPAPLIVHADATYLVTGGLGGLGLELAQRLAARGAGSIALLGRTRERSALDADTEAKLRAIESTGAQVHVFAVDVADFDAMSALQRKLTRVAGIVHAAGVVQLGAAHDLSAVELAAVARPKIDGTLVLARLFPPSRLDFFVCFSSGASIWGSRGLAAYAAGSGFMDGWARNNGATALNWGMWARTGMSSDTERAGWLAAIGLRAMEPTSALDAMEQALHERAPQRVISAMDWSTFRKLYEANAPRRGLLREVESHAVQPPHARVRALLAELTGLADESIDGDAPLNTLGIDSISGLDLKARVGREFGYEVPLTELVQSLTVDELIARAAAALREPNRAHEAKPLQRSTIPLRGEAPPSMSFPQERLWFLEQLDPGSATYNVPGVVRVRGRLDLAQLKPAFQRVLARHEILRTTFVTDGGIPAPVVHERVDLAIAFRDLSSRGSDWPALAREEVRKPFDLATAPLMRLLVLRLASDEHIVVMTLHHIVSDAWSLGVLVQELVAIQAAARSGGPVSLPPLPIQFADFAAWQRDRVARGELEDGLAYWVRGLTDAPRLLELPTDLPRPAVRTGRGALAQLALSDEASQALRACAKQHAVTPFAVCLATYAALLHKYSRQSSVCVGVPVAGRQRPETRDLIGFFVNTIVLRTDFDPELDVRTLLERVMTAVAEGLAHEDVPFERVVSALQVPRSPSHTPLFQAGLAFQNVPRSGLSVPGFELEMLDIDPGVAKFDLHLTVLERDGRFDATLEYSTDVFVPATAERMLEQWSGLLVQAAQQPDLPVEALSLADEHEQRLVVHTWNRTATDFGPEARLHGLIEAQVARTPDKIAIVCGPRRLTYRELDQHANRLAWRLRDAGVAQGEFVGVFIERSAELIVSLLAVLKCGAAYVPFDPSYPHERIEFMARDARARIVLTHAPLRARAAFEQAWVVDLDALASEARVGKPPEAATGESAAYMIYTSGSTGAPKGAINAHRAICNRLQWMQAEMALDPTDVVLQKTPIGFDVSVWELFWPLIAGARELLAAPGGHRDGGYLAQLIQSESVTTLHFVPSMLRTFLEEPRLERLTSLRRIVCSGEALSRDLHDLSLSLWPNAALYNLYGPTEAAVDVSYWKCRLDDRRDVPIGRPIANTQLYVLDGALHPLPVGVPGELYIGGVQVGLGYHRRPELTRERFVPDPFASNSTARLYRTGDLARWHADGTLEYLGRADQQIKLNGCRIEPQEIEAALRAHPGVADAVVLVRSVGTEHSQLVAYVAKSETDVSDQDLRRSLRAVLPEFMVPSFIVSVPELPSTPNGKLDRNALPAPETKLQPAAAAVRDETERAVALLWCELLGRDDIGAYDNFFDVGGHSLLAARLAARMTQRFQLRVSVAALLAAPTVADMAALVRGAPRSVDDIAVEFGPATAARNLFLVHPAAGDASCYRWLANRLRSRARVVGLRSPALTGGVLHGDLYSMAAHYVRALRKVQPNGPYWIGGWSMGGVVAFEIARQLLEAGEEVSALVVIDSFLPSPAAQVALDEESILISFIRDFAAMFGITELPVEAALHDRERVLDALHDACLQLHGEIAPTRAELALRASVFRKHCQAMFAYRPKPLPVRLALVLSEEGAGAEPLYGSWASFGDCVSRLVVEGDHYALLSGPQLPRVVKAVQGVLENAPDSAACARHS